MKYSNGGQSHQREPLPAQEQTFPAQPGRLPLPLHLPEPPPRRPTPPPLPAPLPAPPPHPRPTLAPDSARPPVREAPVAHGGSDWSAGGAGAADRGAVVAVSGCSCVKMQSGGVGGEIAAAEGGGGGGVAETGGGGGAAGGRGRGGDLRVAAAAQTGGDRTRLHQSQVDAGVRTHHQGERRRDTQSEGEVFPTDSEEPREKQKSIGADQFHADRKRTAFHPRDQCPPGRDRARTQLLRTEQLILVMAVSKACGVCVALADRVYIANCMESL